MARTPTPDRALPAIPPRRLRGVCSLRDIADVEGLVTTVLERLSLPLEGAASDRLVLAGVQAIFRVERAVPRDQALGPALEGVLEQRLLELSDQGDGEPPPLGCKRPESLKLSGGAARKPLARHPGGVKAERHAHR